MVQLTSSPPDVFPRDASAYFKAKSFCCRVKQQNDPNSQQRCSVQVTDLVVYRQTRHVLYVALDDLVHEVLSRGGMNGGSLEMAGK